MVERDGLKNEASWNDLQIPDDYHKVDKRTRQQFLSRGTNTLIRKMEDLNFGLHVLGNVELINKLIITPIEQKESIPINEFSEAGVGCEYLVDVFVRGWEPVPVEIEGMERQIVVGFLGELNDYLKEKYNPKPTTLDRVRRLLRIK